MPSSWLGPAAQRRHVIALHAKHLENLERVGRQAYAILRQRYMTGGEALINHWHDRIKDASGGTAAAAGSPHQGGASKQPRSARHADSSKFWTALLELVDVNAQVCKVPDLGEAYNARLPGKPEPPLHCQLLQVTPEMLGVLLEP